MSLPRSVVLDIFFACQQRNKNNIQNQKNNKVDTDVIKGPIW